MPHGALLRLEAAAPQGPGGQGCACALLAHLRAGPSMAPPSSLRRPRIFNPPPRKIFRNFRTTTGMGPSSRSAAEGPCLRRQGPNQTKSPRNRSSMPNVSCWGISRRTGDVAGESACSQERTSELQSLDPNILRGYAGIGLPSCCRDSEIIDWALRLLP